jgi:chemotaxis protein CheX
MSHSHLKLPPVLDATSSGDLVGRLRSLRGGSVVLDASDVDRVGALGLQVLLSAQKTWAADGASFEIHDPSIAFRGALALSGGAPLLSESLKP